MWDLHSTFLKRRFAMGRLLTFVTVLALFLILPVAAQPVTPG